MAVPPETLPSAPPRATRGFDTALLADIFEPGINLAILERQVDPALRSFCEQQLIPSGLFAHELAVRPQQDPTAELPDSVRGLPGAAAFLEELNQVHTLWQDLFEPECTGLRLRVLNRPMCPRFHVDHVLVRLIVSYGGVGTEWLPEQAIDRSMIGRPLPDARQDPLAETDAIQAVPPYAIALLKGEAWPGNEGRGLVHRSPPIQPPERRALLTLDLLDA